VIEFVWHEERVPSGLPVRQVHGWLAGRTGRFLLQDRAEQQRFQLAGGKSEDTGPDWAFTLIRESDEESQVTVERDSIAYLGHRVVTGDPVVPGPYVQVRRFWIVREFRPPEPDPDNGHVYRRLMTAAPQAARLLAWGPPGDLQSRAAARAARRIGLPVDVPAPDGYA